MLRVVIDILPLVQQNHACVEDAGEFERLAKRLVDAEVDFPSAIKQSWRGGCGSWCQSC